jgi:uncharacterized membrane-anchored protein
MSQRTGMGYRYFPVRAIGKTWDIANVFADEDDEEMVANVRLIATAPELLKEIRDARDDIAVLNSRAYGWRELDATAVDQMLASRLKRLRDVIAKAEGRE